MKYYSSRKSSQAGMSLISLIIFGVILLFVGLLVARIVPTAIEYGSAVKVINKAKTEATISDVRSAFAKGAQLNSITSLTAEDLDISGSAESYVIKFNYNKELHIMGPAYLLLKYEGRSN